jgi:hypothetical protein
VPRLILRKPRSWPAWTVPKYDRPTVNGAARVLASSTPLEDEAERAFDVINNWRSSHNFPLNSFQVRLRNKARQADAKALVAQRIKRLQSILLKLRRFRPSARYLELERRSMNEFGEDAVLVSVDSIEGLRRAYPNYFLDTAVFIGVVEDALRAR